MSQSDWQIMNRQVQTLHSFARLIVTQSKPLTLTASELEIVSHIYLNEQKHTPLSLSKITGMKKESVSRSLKSLYEKGLVDKERCPEDERSYQLILTQTGLLELDRNYQLLLKPYYYLEKHMGEDFDRMMQLVEVAGILLRRYRDGEGDDVV
nr:MarR family transcriptional regulator [uncultured Solibaculum sp.]